MAGMLLVGLVVAAESHESEPIEEEGNALGGNARRISVVVNLVDRSTWHNVEHPTIPAMLVIARQGRLAPETAPGGHEAGTRNVLAAPFLYKISSS
jgi:hypothetical protein